MFKVTRETSRAGLEMSQAKAVVAMIARPPEPSKEPCTLDTREPFVYIGYDFVAAGRQYLCGKTVTATRQQTVARFDVKVITTM